MTHARLLTQAYTQGMASENTALKLKLAVALSELRRLRAIVEAQDKRIAALEDTISNWTGDL